MPFNLSTFKKTLKISFKQIEADQSEALAVEIAANFVAGQAAAEEHKSIKSADPDDEGLTEDVKEEIAVLVALYLGYITEFNNRAQAQIIEKVQALVEAGSNQGEIKQYLDNIFSGQETIIIDNTGQKRKEIYVDENLKLSEVTRTVLKPFYASFLTYTLLIGANASHTAYETGRKTYYRGQGFNQWVFVGPADEIARPWHVCLIGEVYTWGTEQSNYAEQCLHEPHCRHRSQVYYNDPDKDTPKEYWEKLKKDSGLHWDAEKEEWALK